jgi:hypothetical protein
MSQPWPVADLDPIRRLQVIAATTPGVIYAEQHIPVPFSAVWAVASDLENELPRIITDVRTFQVTASAAGRLQARARSRLGLRARFDVVLRPGWCLMQSRFLIFGMAAVPEADGTRFAGLAALRIPGARMLGPVNRRLLTQRLAHGAIGRLAERAQPR